MFIILNVGYRLVQVAIWGNTRLDKTVLNLAEEFFQNWNSVLANDNTFHLYGFDLIVPLMSSDISNGVPFSGLRVQYLFNEVL